MGVQSLGREDPLEEGTAPHSGTAHMAVFLTGESTDRGVWQVAVRGVVELDSLK